MHLVQKTEVDDSAAGGQPASLQATDSTARAYEHLRAAILSGELAPGSEYSQVQLAEDLALSRTPLREAFRLLQTEGLVHADFNRRVQVAPLTLDDLEDLYAMRIMLEPLAVQLCVPTLTAEELNRIEEALEMTYSAARSTDVAGARDAHRLFHLAMFAKVGTRLRRQVVDLWDYAERYRVLYARSDSDRIALLELARGDHGAIMEAARRGQARRCGQLVANHLGRTALSLVATVEGGRDPRAIREALRMMTTPAEA